VLSNVSIFIFPNGKVKAAGAKTIKQGVSSVKKWHKENPYPTKTKKK
jgi:TATA-box binding protein (TBP) (component of TFIID and TFIIIB)